MKMKYFFSSWGYLDLSLPNLKVSAQFQNFKLMVMEKLMDGSVCPYCFELHHHDKTKVSSLVNLLPISWSVGTFR